MQGVEQDRDGKHLSSNKECSTEEINTRNICEDAFARGSHSVFTLNKEMNNSSSYFKICLFSDLSAFIFDFVQDEEGADPENIIFFFITGKYFE